MIFPHGTTQATDHETASEVLYDAVIVGSGISGAIIASELSRAGQRVLILEAGPGGDRTLRDYEDYLNRFYETAFKDNQSPYPETPDAPMPRSTDARKIRPGQPDASAYLVQNGPFSTDTTYTRVLGGTTMHWEAKTPRMLPEDFRDGRALRAGRRLAARTTTSSSRGSPAPSARSASRRTSQTRSTSGSPSSPATCTRCAGCRCPTSTRPWRKGVDGTPVELDGEHFELKVRPFPQGRNGIPNPAYDGGKGFTPVGAVSTSQVDEGGRCQGNLNCVPICPVQAKYNAGKTLAKALQTGRVDLLTQTVASKVCVDPDSGRVTHIEYKTYGDGEPTHRERARAHLRAGRQRDREPAADAGVGADEHQRAGGAQPDGPRVPAELGAAARDRRHDARDRLHGRHQRPARRGVPPPPGRRSPSTSTTTAGAGPPARRTRT